MEETTPIEESSFEFRHVPILKLEKLEPREPPKVTFSQEMAVSQKKLKLHKNLSMQVKQAPLDSEDTQSQAPTQVCSSDNGSSKKSNKLGPTK
jgi:hypothetical protein